MGRYVIRESGGGEIEMPKYFKKVRKEDLVRDGGGDGGDGGGRGGGRRGGGCDSHPSVCLSV